MTNRLNHIVGIFFGLNVAFLVFAGGCSKSTSDSGVTVSSPKEAASQIQEAFANANAEVKNNAEVASQALRTADYEKAIQSLEAMKARQNLTFEQGMAVHNSMISLEARLIAAMDSGDPNAKRAYELLKKSRRN